MNVKTHTNTARVDCHWAIGLLFQEGLKFVTQADNRSKYFYWESGEEPLFFESKRTADDYALGMALNGYPAVVMEIPVSFNVKNREGGESEEKASEA